MRIGQDRGRGAGAAVVRAGLREGHGGRAERGVEGCGAGSRRLRDGGRLPGGPGCGSCGGGVQVTCARSGAAAVSSSAPAGEVAAAPPLSRAARRGSSKRRPPPWISSAAPGRPRAGRGPPAPIVWPDPPGPTPPRAAGAGTPCARAAVVLPSPARGTGLPWWHRRRWASLQGPRQPAAAARPRAPRKGRRPRPRSAHAAGHGGTGARGHGGGRPPRPPRGGRRWGGRIGGGGRARRRRAARAAGRRGARGGVRARAKKRLGAWGSGKAAGAGRQRGAPPARGRPPTGGRGVEGPTLCESRGGTGRPPLAERASLSVGAARANCLLAAAAAAPRAALRRGGRTAARPLFTRAGAALLLASPASASLSRLRGSSAPS
jgi:hypothetical protein